MVCVVWVVLGGLCCKDGCPPTHLGQQLGVKPLKAYKSTSSSTIARTTSHEVSKVNPSKLRNWLTVSRAGPESKASVYPGSAGLWQVLDSHAGSKRHAAQSPKRRGERAIASYGAVDVACKHYWRPAWAWPRIRALNARCLKKKTCRPRSKMSTSYQAPRAPTSNCSPTLPI